MTRAFDRARSGSILAGHLFGLTMTWTNATTITVAPGFCADSTGLHRISVGTATVPTIDTGVLAVDKWYQFFAIYNPTTGESRLIYSNTTTPDSGPAAPPAGFTAWRRIFSWRTNGSSQWMRGVQSGDDFIWDAPFIDVSSFSGATSIQPKALTVPPGVRVKAKISAGLIPGASTNGRAYIWSPDVNSGNVIPSGGAVSVLQVGLLTPNATQGWFPMEVVTDKNQTIYFAIGNADASLYINTYGWADTRGRLAA